MKKKLSIRLLFNAAVVLSLISCRSEDLLNSSEELPPTKFRVFTAQGKETINYAKGFKTLLEHYDEINNVQHTAKALRKALKNSSEMANEYVELNIHSQDFTTKGNEKFTLFPLIKNGKVDGIIIARLKENDTQVEFLKMYTEAENYSIILKMFKEAYLKNTLPQRIAAKGNGNCSSDGSPCDTGEVIITMPGAGGGYTGGVWNGDNLPPGGCKSYENCLNPEGPGGTGGGEGNGPTPNGPQLSPCEKIKDQTIDPAFKEKIKELDKNSVLSQKKESGFSESKSGGFTKLQPSASTEHSDGMTIHVTSDTKGYIHTHLNDYLTGDTNDEGLPIIKEPIRMFSPADVETLMTMAGFIKDGNYSEIYGTMVSSYGNYTIKFTGTASDIKTGFGTEEWKTKYVEYRKENGDWSFEKLFLNFLKDKMNVQGVELYKIKDNGTVQNKSLNSDNKVQSQDCPQ